MFYVSEMWYSQEVRNSPKLRYESPGGLREWYDHSGYMVLIRARAKYRGLGCENEYSYQRLWKKKSMPQDCAEWTKGCKLVWDWCWSV